jgi:hypothetical protein
MPLAENPPEKRFQPLARPPDVLGLRSQPELVSTLPKRLLRQWKTPRRRRAALALGVRRRLASNTAGSGRGLAISTRHWPSCNLNF